MQVKKLRFTLFVLLLLFGLLLAACGGGNTQTGTTPAAATTAPAAAATTAAPAPETDTGGMDAVEVFSWWTGGGEAAGLDAMIALFKEKYPDTQFINAAVAGGAGTNARAVLATRLQANDPPDSWQGHAGQELIGTYVAANQLEPLNFLYEEEGWYDVMPSTLIPLMSQGGNIYSVPVNIHRANVLWANPKVLAEYGVDMPTTLDEWFAVMDELQAAGMDEPLALGEQWTAMHLFETILLASLGPDGYEELWTGGDWSTPAVAKALADFEKVLSYTNSDASALSWQDAGQLVVDGDAAFNVMGDWQEGFFRELGLTPNEDYVWAPVPGTAGNFQFLSDSFVLPKGAPHREAAINWLRLAGSKEGQDAFNPVKGSIPARSDGDRSLYGEYLQSAMDDWANNRVVGSLTHGVVANDSWKSEIDTALGLYLGNKNVTGFQAALTAAATGADQEAIDTTAPTTTATVSGPVEIFSWWTGGGEAAGLDAMIKVFQEQYPDVEFINAAVAGGAGTNARAVLATRLQANDPPDSWQGHAGQELIGTYVAANQLEPVNFLYEENGWLDVMPETLIPLISQDGDIYSVPVNIHRANVLWANPKVLVEYGVDMPTTLDEWFAAMDELQAAGMAEPLALGEQWTALHLFETILLASLGPDGYDAIWSGADDWSSPEVTQALENFAKILTYTNSDASALSWQDAGQLVVDGDAAFNVMGDWQEGFYRELGLTPNEDYVWAPVPGTAGNFQFLSDSFVLPVGAPNREAAIAWLTVAGSQAGQDAFNPVKGSIPARSDGDRSLYGEYLLSAMDDWANDRVTGSLTHGVVANDSWKAEIDTALGLFLGTGDVAALQSALVNACASSGACK
ncbi:MAG: carbohydrate ABC transporter substrate-binding protein [Anaerolineae bacterium]|nr:carbohydrate ABC transporter substrate-binding protein [Anaerolineae bacterium]